MRKVNKIINIALIFMLMGVFLFSDISYVLRVSMGEGKYNTAKYIKERINILERSGRACPAYQKALRALRKPIGEDALKRIAGMQNIITEIQRGDGNKKPKLQIREEFRRDGLAASFLADGQMMKQIALSFPGSILCIGYPSSSFAETRRVEEILESLRDLNIEPAIYSHALKEHLELSGRLVSGYPRASVCFWVPISDRFIGSTLRIMADEVMQRAINLVLEFRERFSNDLDVALADTTVEEKGLIKRISGFTRELHKAGARSVIICDTRGIGSWGYLKQLFQQIREETTGSLEFHPHNDNRQAILNVEIAKQFGVNIIDTALYHSSERGSMLDPRDLIGAGYDIDFRLEHFIEFEQMFTKRTGMNPDKAVQLIYGGETIVTGTQYRLRGRPKDARLIFGATSDKFILAMMLSVDVRNITNEMLDKLKQVLYDRDMLYLSKAELQRIAGEIFGESELQTLFYRPTRSDL